MTSAENCFDRVYRELQNLAAHWPETGPEAGLGQLGRLLPDVFRLLRRIVYDLEMEAADRRLAALAVLYLADPVDFLPDTEQLDVERRLDDMWVVFTALSRLIERGAVARLETHWRSAVPFYELLAIRGQLADLGALLPPRVHHLVEQFLAE
jgi:uncharacterized membrane protein YkvA (DUF1232 family)